MSKITQEGQHCRDCDKPVRRVIRKSSKVVKKGRWFWPSYLYCIGCKKRYFVESEKVLVRAARKYKQPELSKRVERY